MRKSGIAWVFAALALASCVENVPTARWSKPGATYDQFVEDRAACVSEARRDSAPFYVGGARYAGRPDALDSSVFFPCMAARGYREDPKGFAAPDLIPLSP